MTDIFPNRRVSLRRGRPRQSPRPDSDTGTPELAAKRALGLTADLIDLLMTKEYITEKQRKTAIHFRRLYVRRFGLPVAQAVNWLDATGTPGMFHDELLPEMLDQEYKFLSHAIDCHHLQLVIRATVFNSMDRNYPHILHHLQTGLNELAKAMKMFRSKTAIYRQPQNRMQLH